MKFICIGRNYADHAKELQNDLPAEPVIFLKPSTALLDAGARFRIPTYSSDVHHEIEIVLRIGRSARDLSEKDAWSCVDGITVGLDFTARDIQNQLKAKGLPWEKAKAFDGSAAIGELMPIVEFPSDNGRFAEPLTFQLKRNGEIVQNGNTDFMMFSFPRLLAFASEIFTLERGDMIFTGTPAGVGPVRPGDRLEGFLGERRLLHVEVDK